MGVTQKTVKIEPVEDPFEPQNSAPQSAGGIKVAPTEDPYATDYSTSFEDTLSGTENCTGMSDNEVESSQLYGSESFPFDGFSSMFPMRKKKLTSQWRNYIRPLMWRCKWAQLKMMEFRSQALKYEREIARLEKRKQLKSHHGALGNLGTKYLPSTSQSQGEKVMKRRKRKRVEDDPADITSYLSQHNLFSYVENKRAEQDGSSVNEEFGNPVIADRNLAGHEVFVIRDDSSFWEPNYSNEFIGEIFQNIEAVHSRLQNMKFRLISVLEENCMNFSSSEDLSLLQPHDGQVSIPQSPDLSHDGQVSIPQSPNLSANGDMSPLGAFFNEIGGFIVPDSMVENYGVPFLVPDIIESTASLLTSADVTMLQPQIGDSCEAIMDNVQLQDEAAERERLVSENRNKQTTEKNQEIERRSVKVEYDEAAPISASEKKPVLEWRSDKVEYDEAAPISALEEKPVSETVTPREPSRLTSSLASEMNFSISKRKRGERKAGSGGWHL